MSSKIYPLAAYRRPLGTRFPKPPPLPRVRFAEVFLGGKNASVAFDADPFSVWGGVVSPHTQTMRPEAPAKARKLLKEWWLIQLERKRLGLPYLTVEEMDVIVV